MVNLSLRAAPESHFRYLLFEMYWKIAIAHYQTTQNHSLTRIGRVTQNPSLERLAKK